MDSVEKAKKTKMKSVFKIPLIIISCLIIVIIGLGAFIYFNDGNTYEIYNKIIDKTFDSLSNEALNLYNKSKISGKMQIEMSGDNLDEYESSLMDIINDISIEYLVEADANESKANINLNAKYMSDELLNAYVNIIDKDTFIKVPSLYDKTIKNSETDLYLVLFTKEEISEAIKELKIIVQNNLKEEYFSKEKVTLNINDKDIYTTKHTLELNSQDLYDFEKEIIDDIKENDKILELLVKYYNSDKNEVINELNSIRNELVVEDVHVKIELYINLFTKKIERVSLIDEVESIIFTRKDKNKYDITNTIKDMTTLIGNITYKEDELKITFDYDDILIDLEINENNSNIKLATKEGVINGNASKKDGKLSYLYEVVVEADGAKVKLSVDGVEEEVSKISDKIISDYVLSDEITDEDYLSIYENLYNNEALINLITDISEIYDSFYSDENIYEDYFSHTF